MYPRRDYLFNTIAGLINASEAVIMMMIVTRFASISDAGCLTVAFAVGNLLMSIGKFGVYNYLVSDSKDEYSYKEYFLTRIITVIAMIVCSLICVLYASKFWSYTNENGIIILSVAFIYAVESIEDLYVSLCQKNGWLYKGSFMFISRWVSILTVFGVTTFYTHNVSYSLLLALAISVVVLIINLIVYRAYYTQNRDELYSTDNYGSNGQSAIQRICSLFIATFPLFLSSFLTFYISNASKYSLAHYASSEIQACYGFVAMPVFAISLLNSFVYHPQIVNLTICYKEGHIRLFLKKIAVQYVVIALISIICLMGAYMIGIPILSWLYNTNLADYHIEMMVLLLAGGFLGLSGYQSVILTIMRQQQYILYGYIPVSILALLSTNHIVRFYGTKGAAISYLALMIILSIIYEIIIRIKTKKELSMI